MCADDLSPDNIDHKIRHVLFEISSTANDFKYMYVLVSQAASYKLSDKLAPPLPYISAHLHLLDPSSTVLQRIIALLSDV